MKLVDLRDALSRSLGLPPWQLDSVLARITPTIEIETFVGGDGAGGGGSAAALLDRSFMVGAQAAAVAAEYGMFQLYNPTNSGVIVLLERVVASPNTEGGYLRIGYSAAAENPFGGTALHPTLRNRLLTGSSAANFYYGTNAALYGGAASYGRIRGAYMSEIVPPLWILDEGTGVIIQNETVNVVFGSFVCFKELSKF